MSAALEEDQGGTEGGGLTGEVIGGKYELERYIGSGAFGAVYRARHRILEKIVALKILRPNMARSEALVELFKREARAASRIDHPNSVRVLDFGKDASGLLFIVMELVEGPDLLRVLNEDFPLGHERVIEMMSQVLSALSMAHSLGVVHRDLKPENILVLSGTSDEGNMIDLIKICDFGIAQLSPAAVPQLPPRSRLEQPTVIDGATLVGTPEYMSPEQARSEKLDARSDVYSAGVLLFQLVTGRLPFLAETSHVVAMMQCSAQPPHPSWFRGVDPRFDTICLKAMNKDPKDRYQSAREMRTALRRLTVTGEDSLASPVADSAPAPDASTMNPPPSLPVAARSQLRLRRAVFVVAMTLASSAGAAAYLRQASSARSTQRASMRAERSLPRVRSATKEQPPTIVVRDEPPALPDAVAGTVTDFPALVVERDPTPEPTNLGVGLASQAAPRSGRPVQRASAPTAAAAISLPEVLSISAPVGSVGSSEGGAIDRVATTDLGPEPEPSALAAVQADSSGSSVGQATAPSRLDAIPAPAKNVPKRMRPEPLSAVPRIDDVSVRGSLATSVVQRAMDRARPLLSACYAQAAKAAGRNGFSSMKITVEFNERGRARRAYAAGAALPGLDRCVAQVAANLVAAQAPDTGTVRATWRVSFER